MAVFEALYNDDAHPTAEVIWARVHAKMPTVSLRTVYQALNDLVEMNEVQIVTVGNGASRFDPNITAHHHFICRNCERVYDVAASQPRMFATPDQLLKPTATKANRAGSATHTIEATEIIFRGLCTSCEP